MKDLVISQLDGERGLRLVGELDLQSAQPLREAFASLPGEGQAKLDLTDLTFIDSSGLHAIVDLAQGENGNGALILEGASAMVVRLFEITNIADHPNLEIRVSTGGS